MSPEELSLITGTVSEKDKSPEVGDLQIVEIALL
jgi:hypothetical protein